MPRRAFRFVADRRAMRDVSFSPPVRDYVDDLGDDVAERARQLAPKRTGAGAASIHAEAGEDRGGAYADVSYDEAHSYMAFAELGSEHEPPQPFLRPALDQTRL